MKGITRKPLRVLTIDPNPDVSELLKFHSERLDRKIYTDTARSKEEALENLESHVYDAVVSEYDLGDTNAIELLEEVREMLDVPFIIHSKYYSSLLEEKADRTDATAYLKKRDDNSYYLKLVETISDEVNENRSSSTGFRPNILGVYNTDGDLVRYNDAFLEAVDCSSDEVEGLKPWEAFGDTKESEFKEVLMDAASSEEIEAEAAIVTPTGLVNYDIKAVKIQEEPEVLIGILGVSREELEFIEPEKRVINRVNAKKTAEMAG